MTVASSLLLALEPRPQVSKVAGVSGVAGEMAGAIQLQQRHRPADPVQTLFATAVPIDVNRWSGIVIHDSGTLGGTVDELAAAHEQLKIDGLGYHFVIDCGEGRDDGQVEIRVGRRWLEQSDGQFVNGKDRAQWRQPGVIGVCVIGDTDRQAMTGEQQRQLVWLVRQLQSRIGIDDDGVAVPSAGRLFPIVPLRNQLLTRRDR
jgi:hypothetical protein